MICLFSPGSRIWWGRAPFRLSTGLRSKKSLEYKYKPVHIGTGRGVFLSVGYDSGEFLYKDVSLAYSKADEKKGKAFWRTIRITHILCPHSQTLITKRKSPCFRFRVFRKREKQGVQYRSIFLRRVGERGRSGSCRSHRTGRCADRALFLKGNKAPNLERDTVRY